MALCSVTMLALFATLAVGDAQSPAIAGFSPQASQKENRIETQLKNGVSRQQLRQYLRHLTAQLHPAGTVENNELARYLTAEWKRQGLEDVVIHRYDVLNSTPRDVSLEMVSPAHYRASLCEDSYAVDPDTKNPKITGSFFGYSASGDVTEAVESKGWTLARQQANILQHALEKNTALVQAMLVELGTSGSH